MKKKIISADVKKRHSIFIIIFFCCALSLTGCLDGVTSVLSGATGSPTDGNSIDSGVVPTGNNATEEGSTETELDSDSIPTGQIFIPSLVDSSIISYASDDESTVPVAFLEGAVTDYEEGSMVAISTEDFDDVLACFESPEIVSNTQYVLRKIKDAIIPTAYADAEETLCDADNVTCCEVQSTDFTCYHPLTDQSVSSVHIVLLDPSFTIASESSEQQIQSNLLWASQSVTDVVVSEDGTMYSIANNVAVKITDSKVTGDYDDANGAYRYMDASGSKFSFDSSNEYFGFMDSTSGVSVVDLSGTLIGTPRTIEGATSYTKIKNTTYNKVYFGVEKEDATEAEVYYYFSDYTEDYEAHHGNNDIQFITSGDIDSEGLQLTHAKTISYDANSEGYAIIAYKDIAGNFRIRVSNYTYDVTGVRFGGAYPITITNADSTTPDFKDIHFVDDETAYLLDAANDMVWIIKVDVDAQSVTYQLDSTSNGIAVVDNPIAMTFNTDKSRLYVSNETGVSVINAKNGDGSVRVNPQVVATELYNDALTNKSLTFSPAAIAFYDSKLAIACENTKAILLMDTANITETTISEEDNDSDGYSGLEGDCDDTDATLNPETVWYADSDGDGFGEVGDVLTQCEQPTGYVANDTDCDDGDATSYPGASELCDGIDNDCDDVIDEDATDVSWYADADGDGFGDPASERVQCRKPRGPWILDGTDCDDGDSTSYPGATEIEDDGADNDCDGTVDEVAM